MRAEPIISQVAVLEIPLPGILQGCNQMCAGYLFQQDKQYNISYDTGDEAIQCGRHVAIFKFWLMYKAKGTEGFEQQINKCLELSEYLYQKVSNREDFAIVFKGERLCPLPDALCAGLHYPASVATHGAGARRQIQKIQTMLDLPFILLTT
ncbi:glutamate decarboxylase 1-like [Aquarana catesbeiana]|uniref:glutamate decarboxylase 1-like n=1 Tax=Aquarana catesbeiana TaxID=8400 RepID=UPI003CC95056